MHLKGSKEILCIADHVDPLIYSPSMKERMGHVNAVFSCGDLKPHYYEFIVTNLNVPFLYVLGNHSKYTLHPDKMTQFGELGQNENGCLFCGGILADGKCIRLKKLDLIVAGLGGSINYSGGDNQYTEVDMFFRILKIIPVMIWNRIFHGRYLDILLTHSPPRHINDQEDYCHRGFRIFRWFIRRFKPVFLLHGHVHLYDSNAPRESLYMGTRVINTYDHYILKLSGENENED